MKKLSEKRKKDYFRQLLYFHEHPNCEVCGKPAIQVHEIVYKSEGGKCEEDNMISICQKNHDRFLQQGGQVHEVNRVKEELLFTEQGVILDSLFGTGFPKYSFLIAFFSAASAAVIAL